MKKLLILTTFLFLCLLSRAQISYEQTYAVGINQLRVVKFHLAGYKYFVMDPANSQFRLYNPNHSLYKTVTIPPISATAKQVLAVSDQLFNSNSQIEYVLNCVTQTSNPPAINYTVFVFDENGQQLFKRVSASFSTTMSGNFDLMNPDPIFYMGNGTKMRLEIQAGNNSRQEIYSLPGTIPCSECTEGSVNNMVNTSEPTEVSGEKAVFYPNPVKSESLKLKYTLPKEAKTAELKIYSSEGKLIDKMKIGSDFDYVLLPSEYNNGLYFYSISVDNKVIQTEKIILSR